MIKLDNRTQLLIEIKNEKNDIENIVEVGVFKGEFAKELIKIFSPKKIYLVDIFQGHAKSGDKDGNNYQVVNLDNEFIKLKKEYDTNPSVDIIKSDSKTFLKELPDNSIDLIYIDGDHSYEGVKNDLQLSFSKVKNNGYICGHDYIEPRFKGVVRAVNEFCEENNLTIKYITNDGCPSYCILKN